MFHHSMHKTGWLAALAMVMLLNQACQAGSLWAKSTAHNKNSVSDDVASDVGDVLTVLINETSVIENKTNRNDEKKTARTVDASGKVDLATLSGGVGKNDFAMPSATVNLANDNKFDAKANYDTKRTMTDMITVTVQDVLPNGNLVVVGTRTREVAGDKQIIEISGIVRPSDISFSNTVESDRVADFHVVHKTKGQDSTYVRQGWMTRFLNVISPF